MYCIRENENITNQIMIDCWNKINSNQKTYECLRNLYRFKGVYDHSIHVAYLAVSLGIELRLQNLEELFIAALFHDYGKTFIPKAILYKPGPLTDKEMQIMKTHTKMGYLELKRKTNLCSEILLGIYEHHERCNGSGYPERKKESEISLFGRVIAPIDVFCAMVMQREYRDYVYDFQEAQNHLKNNAGKLFDESIVDSLISYLSKTY